MTATEKDCRCCGGISQSMRVKGATGINQPCHGNTSGVTGHNKHVIGRPRIVAIYWDQYFTNTPAAPTKMNQFLTDLVTGTYMTGLSEYGVETGAFEGSSAINMTDYPTPNSATPGVAFSESQVQAQLAKWLDDGVVTPKPSGTETAIVYLRGCPTDRSARIQPNARRRVMRRIMQS